MKVPICKLLVISSLVINLGMAFDEDELNESDIEEAENALKNARANRFDEERFAKKPKSIIGKEIVAGAVIGSVIGSCTACASYCKQTNSKVSHCTRLGNLSKVSCSCK